MPGSIRKRQALNQDGKNANVEFNANDDSTHHKSDASVSLVGKSAAVKVAIKNRTKAAGCGCK